MDVYIASDMLSKAYENHYEIAVVIMGDRDFLPLVDAVKNLTGKRVFGVVFDKHYTEDLRYAFDKCLIIDKSNVNILL